MSYTKRQFVTAAFEELGLSAYTYDLQPEDYASAGRRLDAMMATWNGKGVRLGYPLVTNPDNLDLDVDTAVPDSANEAIITNLAVRIAPQYGKVVSPDTKAAAKAAYDVVLARAARPLEYQLPSTMPAGAGNKPWVYGEPFLPGPTEHITTGPEGPLEFY